MNFSQFETQLNSASASFLLLFWKWIFHKKNFNFMKGEFVCMNKILLIFRFRLPFRPEFSTWNSHSLKENSILHLFLSFFYSDEQFIIRKIFILSKLNSSAWMKISLFFSFFCHSDLNSRSEFLTVRKRIQFCICSFFSSTLKMNFW